MAAAYSMDLRTRVIKDADGGLTSKELAARYHVSRAWVDALKQRRRETGAIAPHKQTKFRRRVLAGQEASARGAGQRPARCDARRIARGVADVRGLGDDLARAHRLDFTVKKNACTPTNSGGLTSRAERRQWRDWLPLRDARHYVFLDECGVTTDLLRRYGRSPRGTRLHDHTPCGHWETQHRHRGASARSGERARRLRWPDRRVSFRAYVEQVLVPTLRPGDVVVLDNLAVHKQPRSASPSKPSARASGFCRPTVPTSIPSNRRSPN